MDARGKHQGAAFCPPPLQALLPPALAACWGAAQSLPNLGRSAALLKALSACSVQRGKVTAAMKASCAMGLTMCHRAEHVQVAVMLLGACCQKAVG